MIAQLKMASIMKPFYSCSKLLLAPIMQSSIFKCIIMHYGFIAMLIDYPSKRLYYTTYIKLILRSCNFKVKTYVYSKINKFLNNKLVTHFLVHSPTLNLQPLWVVVAKLKKNPPNDILNSYFR